MRLLTPTDFGEMSRRTQVCRSLTELLRVVVGIAMVKQGVWRKCRSGGWMKGGEDVELILAGVRIGYSDDA